MNNPPLHTDRSVCMNDAFMRSCRELTQLLPSRFPDILPRSRKKSLLIETRALPHLEFVIKNTILKLGEGWGHMVMCSEENYGQVAAICADISDKIDISLAGKAIRSIDDYNSMCLDAAFWEAIDCEKILFYQSDTFLFEDLSQRFLEYDYIGAPWGPGAHSARIRSLLGLPEELICGNGGLSLRSVSLMKQALADPGFSHWKNITELDRKLSQIPEDVFFSLYASRHGKIPSAETALAFSFEGFENLRKQPPLHKKAFGAHRVFDLFSTEEELAAYLEQHLWVWLTEKAIQPEPVAGHIEGYLHTACMGGHWQSVFRELWDGILAGGLYDATRKIHVCVSGSEASFRELKSAYNTCKKIAWTWNGPVIDRFEYPTLDLMHRNASIQPAHKIWYAHTKGVSADFENPFYKYWRRTLVRSNLYQWQKHCIALDGYDTSGESWCCDPAYPKHYSGNFWWANSTFIRQLENIQHYWENPRPDWRPVKHDRFQPEMWLSTRNVRAKSFGVFNPIRYKKRCGIGFSHFVLAMETDPHTCTLNTLAERKIMLLQDMDTESIALCRRELQKTGLENVQLARSLSHRHPRKHQKEWQQAWEDGSGTLLIIEGDTVFARGFSEIFTYCFPKVPKDWEVIHIGYDDAIITVSLVNDCVGIPLSGADRKCYLVNRKGIGKLLNTKSRQDHPFFQAHPQQSILKEYVIMPSLVDPANKKGYPPG